MIFVLIAILAAVFLILVHEFGHFVMAKLFKIPVDVFTFGYGRPFLKFKWKGTTYGIGAFPLGAYVKIPGMDPREKELLSEEERASFNLQPFWKRVIVVSGGPLANIFLAVFLFAAMFMIGVPTPTTVIDKVMPSSPAFQAGLKAGDKITAVGGKRVKVWEDAVKGIRASKEKMIKIEVLRKGKKLSFISRIAKKEGVNYIGIQVRESAKRRRLGLFSSLYQGFVWTALATAGFIQALALVIVGKLPFRPVSPIGIVQITSQAAQHGMIAFLDFLALITIVLGISNFLPIFPLDGGRALLWAIERVKGSPLRMQTVVTLQVIGVGLLIVMVVSALYLDIFQPLPSPFK